MISQPRVVDQLRDLVGKENVLLGEDVRSYSEDWTGRWKGKAQLVVRPGDDREVAGVLKILSSNQICYVPQGGNTGLVAGATPLGGEAVVSLRRLRKLSVVDLPTPRAVAEAGVTLAELQDAAPPGWEFPVDLAARGSATVGGMVSTNAGGTRSVSRGRFNSQVVHLEALLANGHVGSSDVGASAGLVEGAAELAGAEGILGVLISAELVYARRKANRMVGLVGLDEMDEVVELVHRAQREHPFLESIEVLDRACMELYCEEAGRVPPLPRSDWYLLVEFSSDDDPLPAMASLLSDVEETRVVVAGGGSADDLWAFRDNLSEAISSRGVPHKFDVNIPLDRTGRVLDRVRSRMEKVDPAAKFYVFGHIGVEDLHINVISSFLNEPVVDDVVLGTVCAEGGRAAGEHGVGRAKVGYASCSLSAERIELLRAAKNVIDPKNLCNPGVLLPSTINNSNSRRM